MYRILKLLGRNVRMWRIARDMTLEQVCAKADVSLYLLMRIEAGKSNPGIGVVFRLARALEVTPSELLIEPATPRKKRKAASPHA